MEKKRSCVLFVAILSLTLVTFTIGFAETKTGQKQNTIVLKAVSFLPGTSASVKPFMDMKDKLNEQAKGELTIKYLGGPEVIPTFQQGEAVRTGVVDISFNAGSNYQKMLPEAATFVLSELAPKEERERGLYDLYVETHKKVNMRFLCKIITSRGFQIGVNKKVEKPQDLAKFKLRGAPIYDRFFKALGVASVVMPWEDVYTAMERGVVDGYGLTLSVLKMYKLSEVTKFVIDHSFYPGGGGVVLVMNQDKWNALPQHLKKLLLDAASEMEMSSDRQWPTDEQMYRKVFTDAGGKFIKFSPQDAEWYIKTAHRVAWEEIIEKSPEFGPKLRKLSTK